MRRRYRRRDGRPRALQKGYTHTHTHTPDVVARMHACIHCARLAFYGPQDPRSLLHPARTTPRGYVRHGVIIMCNFRRTQRIKSAAPDAASASGLGCSGGRNRIPFGWLGQRRPARPARSPP